MPPESPTLGLTHLQFEAMLATARTSSNINDFALVAMLGLLGLRIFEACGATIEDLGEEHGHRVLKVRGKGGKVVLTPPPPAVSRAIERAVADRESGPIMRTRSGTRMDRHCATRRLHRLAQAGGVHAARMHPHMLWHTFVTTMLDAVSHPGILRQVLRRMPAVWGSSAVPTRGYSVRRGPAAREACHDARVRGCGVELSAQVGVLGAQRADGLTACNTDPAV